MDEKSGALSKKKESGGEKSHGGGGTKSKHPHMHIHSHEAGHTLHVMHEDGSHEMHHFAPGDTAGMKGVMDEHMSAGGAGPEAMAAGGGAPMPGAGGAGGGEPEEQAAA